MHLRHWAQNTPRQTAVRCGDTAVTYAELEALSNRLAHVFRSRRLQRGDHVASLLGNACEVFAMAWAAYRCGLYWTPIPTTLAVPEAAYMVDNCDAKLVVAQAGCAALAQPLPGLVPRRIDWFSVGEPIANFEALELLLARASALPGEHEPPGALMLYTSGTTGAPKGVWRPLPPADYSGPPALAADLLELFGLGGSDVRYLSTQPLYHAAALRFALAVTAGGGTVCVAPKFDASTALDLLEREAITHSQWVPVMFQRLMALPEARRGAFAAPAHRCAIHAAAPCAPSLKRSMIDWWGPILVEYYAGSEGVGLTSIDSHEALRKPGSVGRARKGEIHVTGDDGEELPANRTGVIHFSGVAPFAYYKEPQKTAAKTSPQGWQTLGDVGHVDADGHLFLTDRLDDMIISGGVNVYPQEIERVLLEVPGVADCAVVGMADERFGERPVAFVVPLVDTADNAGLLERIEEHARRLLGRIKQPSRIVLIDALPRSATGKLLRRQLRDRHA